MSDQKFSVLGIFALSLAGCSGSNSSVAYYILTQTVTDVDRYVEEYVPRALPFVVKYGGEVIVASFDAEPLQGDPESSVVVLRFPSEQHVRDFVNDPDYQPIKEVRLAVTTNANAVLAPEFQLPDG